MTKEIDEKILVLRKVITPDTKLRKLKALAPPNTPDMFWQVRTFFVFFIIIAEEVQFNERVINKEKFTILKSQAKIRLY